MTAALSLGSGTACIHEEELRLQVSAKKITDKKKTKLQLGMVDWSNRVIFYNCSPILQNAMEPTRDARYQYLGQSLYVKRGWLFSGQKWPNMADLPMSQKGLRGSKMIQNDQYNMFLTIWCHFGIIWTLFDHFTQNLIFCPENTKCFLAKVIWSQKSSFV